MSDTQPLNATEQMIERWSDLARAMAAPGSRDVRRPAGALTIIGSGMAHIDLTLTDEAVLRAADRVFHCTNDRVTQIWINTLRPDALDLRILYDTDKDRFDTYVQMAEALLHCVRNGERVVAVYYGHPGIFATPAHRAMTIARAEGYPAKMRPGISALDYLIADVGFDPMIPGLLSYEASDLLLSRRALDTALHLVLWQVGMVGEFQYSAKGFENRGFDKSSTNLKRRMGRIGRSFTIWHHNMSAWIRWSTITLSTRCAIRRCALA
ncbi:MAG: SAM-dependent methyltransferase [Allosphingosinicella sp.]